MIRCDVDRILAIHKASDSAGICFHKLIVNGEFETSIALTIINTDDYGITYSQRDIFTYTKGSGFITPESTRIITDSVVKP